MAMCIKTYLDNDFYLSSQLLYLSMFKVNHQIINDYLIGCIESKTIMMRCETELGNGSD